MLTPIGNHLWQSTVFAAAIAALVLLFRRQQAGVRYWLWLAASVKFVLPFALLTTVGGQVELQAPLPAAVQNVGAMLGAAGQPFADSAPTVVVADGAPTASAARYWTLAVTVAWLAGAGAVVTVFARRWRRVAQAVRSGRAINDGPVVLAVRRAEARAGRQRPLPIVSSGGTLEPGVFGFLRPVLLWPETMATRLSDEQIEAIAAHEIAHVRRGDNLAALIHMAVQAIFWFHPVVWWVGARLVDERERACDEEVVRRGSPPDVYATSVLKTCECCVESPVVCVAGVTGGALAKRIERIMRDEWRRELDHPRKLLLVVLALAVVGGPVASGALRAQQPGRIEPVTGKTRRFAVTSVKANTVEGFSAIRMIPGGAYSATNAPLILLLQNAYGVQRNQIVGAPDWIFTENFDVEGRPEGMATPEQTLEMLRALLADRFGVRAQIETREVPVHALVRTEADRLGDAIVPMTPEACAAENLPRSLEAPPCGRVQLGHGQVAGRAVTFETLASMMTALPAVTGLDRIVVDGTGSSGTFTFLMKFAFGPPAGTLNAFGQPIPVSNPDRLDFQSEMRDRLGLRVESRRAPVDVLVIERVERPRAN